MSTVSLLKYVQLTRFSRPAADRRIYRYIRKSHAHAIVEIGVGGAERAQRMISVARRYSANNVRYTGIDLFEAREARAPGVTLKLAHRMLKPLARQVQLVPGDPFSALARIANAHANTDLLVIAADQDAVSLARAWFYIPRMLHAASAVFVEQKVNAKSDFRLLDQIEITKLAAAATPNRRAA